MEHFFVAVTHYVQVLVVAVANGNKVGHQVAVAVHDGEISQVLAHGHDQHVLGQLQIRLFKGATQSSGLLNQVGDFGQQTWIVGNNAVNLGS